MGSKKILLMVFLLTLILSIFITGYAKAEKKGGILANTPYVDPKGFFRIVPPAGWEIKEYPDDPRGKVAFLGPENNVDFRILVSVKDFNDFDTLYKNTLDVAKEIKERYGATVSVEKTTFLNKPAVKREINVKGQKMLGIEFLIDNVRHDLQYSAPQRVYQKYLSIVMKSIKTYEPLKKTGEVPKEHAIANRLRLAQLFFEQGNYVLAMEYIKEGLEIDPDNPKLKELKAKIESVEQTKGDSDVYEKHKGQCSIKQRPQKKPAEIKTPFSKEKILYIQSISEIVGEGTIIFKKGQKANSLKVHIDGIVPVAEGYKICLFCLDTIKIGPNMKIPIELFTLTEDESLKKYPFIPEKVEYKGFIVEIYDYELGDEFIQSGKNGAILKKKGKGFILTEGEAWLVKLNVGQNKGDSEFASGLSVKRREGLSKRSESVKEFFLSDFKPDYADAECAGTVLELFQDDPSKEDIRVLVKQGLLPIRNGQPVVFCNGAKHILKNKIRMKNYIFESDTKDPLQFLVDKEKGYIYLSGKGTITMPEGKVMKLPLTNRYR